MGAVPCKKCDRHCENGFYGLLACSVVALAAGWVATTSVFFGALAGEVTARHFVLAALVWLWGSLVTLLYIAP